MALIDKAGELMRKVLPLGNPGKTMLALALFVGLFLLFLALHARAGESYAQVSVGRAMVRGETGVMDLSFAFPAPQARGDAWVASMTLIGASTFRGESVPNNYAFAIQYVTGWRRFDIGLGPAWVANPLPYNGRQVNFALMGGYRFQRWPVTLWWKHYSCGGACAPNIGRDMLLIGYRF